ncbi:MAG: LysR family transcriptional regulator [Faecousia sp.]
MIEFAQLEMLIAFADSLTLSKAAETLHLSQPTLTRAMKQLEEEFRVPLFDHRKNRLTLNENGQLAVEYARKLWKEGEDMVERVRSFDRAKHTLAVGACAPAPLWDLLPRLSSLYGRVTIGSEIRDSQVLIQGLNNGTYQIIVLAEQLQNPDWLVLPWGEEHLFFSLRKSHPLAHRQGLEMRELDGENMLVFGDIGFWHELHMRKMPNSRFLLQNDRFSFDELVSSSVLPCFTTDLSMKRNTTDYTGRVNIPVLDPEANVTYYCYLLRAEEERLQAFLQDMRRR